MTTVLTVTVDQLQPDDHILRHQPSEATYPEGIRGTVTKVEPGPMTRLWIGETGDAEWFVAGVTLVKIRRAA